LDAWRDRPDDNQRIARSATRNESIDGDARDDQVRIVTTTAPTTKVRRRRGPALFLRQVVAELRKVVRPTRTELITYTSVVLVFVLAVMLYVSLLDLGLGRLVLWAFGSK
jgi:preprotein translocase subunit SecE